MDVFEIAHSLEEGIKMKKDGRLEEGFSPFCGWRPFLKQAGVNSRALCNVLPAPWRFIGDVK